MMVLLRGLLVSGVAFTDAVLPFGRRWRRRYFERRVEAVLRSYPVALGLRLASEPAV